MNDLIRREDALTIIERLRDRCENDEMAFALNWAAGIIRDMTAVDAAEVVRCRECIVHDNCAAEDVFKFAGLREDRRFCGVGKRREDVDG